MLLSSLTLGRAACGNRGPSVSDATLVEAHQREDALDGDGREHAAVLITYEAARDENAILFLVAYRFDGRTFRSVATKKVSGRLVDAVRAQVEGIAGGAILVELQEVEGDACCRTRPTAFVLQGGTLVEVDRASIASAASER